jgi:hypothetical protein
MRTAAIGAIVLLCASSAWAQRVRGVVDLNGKPVEVYPKSIGHHGPPERLSSAILLFMTTDCPISNRYAPEIKRLASEYRTPVTHFWLVFPVPSDTKDPDRIRKHLAAFDYGVTAILDTRQSLVKLAGVTVTPEVAVIDPKDRVVYRGRIDDRYVDLGRDRVIPTTHDLEDMLKEAVAGNLLEPPGAFKPRRTVAVGCYLPDLLK